MFDAVVAWFVSLLFCILRTRGLQGSHRVPGCGSGIVEVQMEQCVSSRMGWVLLFKDVK